jgi:uncharacterized protein (TIGR02145 family)
MRKILFILFAGIFIWRCQKTNDGNGNSTVTVIPIAPTTLTATAKSTTQINLSWADNSTNEDGFKVQSKTGSAAYTDVATVNKDITTYSDIGLTPNTTYTYRIYAYNTVGNSPTYTNEVSVTTNQGNNNPESVNDASGNTYPTITIGTQVWMAENLRTTKYNDGTTVPLVLDKNQWGNNYGIYTQLPMMCWYNNQQGINTANKFGALYNWYSINTYTNGNKNICPSGWHVPSDAEWTTLTMYLGGEAVAGGKMKSTGTDFWKSPNNDATNSSGFSGFPCGYRYGEGSFIEIGNVGQWWSSTESEALFAWYRTLYYATGAVYRYDGKNDYGKAQGLSIRCIKD